MELRGITAQEQKRAAKAFITHWNGKGDEKSQAQPFWIELLRTVYGVEDAEQSILFEDRVMIDHTNYIDGRIPETKVLIEQKSVDVDLDEPIKQSDGTYLSPFEQARRYAHNLPYSQMPRWIITCNFKEFRVYDMERPHGDPEVILLRNLDKEFYRLKFLIDTKNELIKRETEISLQAGEIVGKLYDALLNNYTDPTSSNTLKSLNVLCVRLVFLLYAEHADLLGEHLAFHDYMMPYENNAPGARRALIRLFKILDTKPEDRDPYEEESLLAFPYVNGGLFRDENIIIPHLDNNVLDLLLHHASEDFDWSTISPTIFGAVFESTLNPVTRRSGGMHYTSIENIHKVIDPLFLNDLYEEFESITDYKQIARRDKKLREFQNKLGSLTFLDPAAGSGNFLTETYICLRRLENKILSLLQDGQRAFGFDEAENNPIKVSIENFNGIEINDFARVVARTALWIAESQMLKEAEEVLAKEIEFFPLRTEAHIVEDNALQIDWNDIIDKNRLNYIMGNPPFVGNALLSPSQELDRSILFSNHAGDLDYVCCWFKKAGLFIQNTDIRCAFVATNSITQGQQVPVLWPEIFSLGNKIDFAYRTFRWDSEASLMAHVHCVIVGFSQNHIKTKRMLYDSSGSSRLVKNINGYLYPGDHVLIEKRRKPICNVPQAIYGIKPADNGFLVLNDAQREYFVSKDPDTEQWIKPFITAKEFINRKSRWCLWLDGISPATLNRMPLIKDRVVKCREWRSNQTPSGDAYKLKDMPHLMRPSNKFKERDFIVLPLTTSEQRSYIPFGFVEAGSIPGNSVSVIPDADLYLFGVLTSKVHMAWMRVVSGRLKSDYRYSGAITYNTFPWPNPTEEQKAEIEQTARSILDARDLYPDSSLADLYDNDIMPYELRRAHQENDKAVMKAYGFDSNITESTIVEELFKLYQQHMNS